MYRNLDDLRLYTGNAHPSLAEEVTREMGSVLSQAVVTRFADKECRVEIGESVRGLDIVIVQPTCRPVADSFMEVCIMADAFRRASARSITLVAPYFGYARQDKKVQSRAPITARLAADLLQVSGITRMVVIDAHSEQLQGFFSIPFDHLYAGPLYAQHYLSTHTDIVDHPEMWCVVSPDVSGSSRANNLAAALNCEFAVINKKRTAPNVVEPGVLVGDVDGQNCIITDDMMDTCGTLAAATQLLVEAGARDIYIACTHPVLSDPGLNRLNHPQIKEIACLNTIPVLNPTPNLVQISCAKMLADAITLHQQGDSVSKLFTNWRQK